MKPKVLDLFCGCGGISLGFELAGFDVVGGLDINKEAMDTYVTNFPSAHAICGDLREISASEIEQRFKKLNVEVIVGGPPCQGFSAANRYKKEEDDPRNQLFYEFVKVVKLLRPKYVMIENVKGILSWKDGWVRSRIEALLGEAGYSIKGQVLNASDFGVPQNRERAFMVGCLTGDFDFGRLSKVQDKVTVKEAIGELYDFEKKPSENNYTLIDNPSSHYTKYLRHPDNKVYNHEIRYPAEIVQKRISFVKQGRNWKDIPLELFPNNRNNRHSSAFKRLSEDSCSVTIDTGNAHSNYFHPIYDRIPTPREAARLQSFPDAFIFNGTRSSVYRQVGNAVPPQLAKAVATELRRLLENE